MGSGLLLLVEELGIDAAVIIIPMMYPRGYFYRMFSGVLLELAMTS
jgi:hypothetical protein